MSFQSCLKDQEDIFDQPSNVRMQEYLDKAQKVLTSSPNGWLFDYFPDRTLMYGGIQYTLQFTDKDVTVGCELAPGEYETSLYKLNADNGPTLSFDSYNALMHYFATPSPSDYEAMDGDFEFMIMDIQDDCIKLRGKRTENTMYLRRAEKPVGEYMAEVAKSADDQFFTEAEGSVGSKSATAFIDIDAHFFEITLSDKPEDPYGEYFFFTPTGLRFLEPIDIDGTEIESLAFRMDKENNCGVYTGNASDGAAINFTAKLPDNYTFINEYEGEFKFNFGSQSVDVTLVPDADAKTVTLKGISPGFDLVASYNKAYGCIDLQTQQVAFSPYNTYFAAGTSSGFYYQTGFAGVFFVKDLENPGTFKAVADNGPYSKTTGPNFILVMNVGGSWYLSMAPWLIGNTYTISNVKSLTKK